MQDALETRADAYFLGRFIQLAMMNPQKTRNAMMARVSFSTWTLRWVEEGNNGRIVPSPPGPIRN